MDFAIEVFGADTYPQDAARYISQRLSPADGVVLTGGTTVESVYGGLASSGADWSKLSVFFSD